MKDKILSFFSERQVIETGYGYPRGDDYKGYSLNDDESPLYTYKCLSDFGTSTELKKVMREMRDDGLVELVPAVDYHEYKPCGSGWGLTQKGLEYVVDNELIVKD
jgi:hypothetical protein